jgi:L-iditol 2-dehydrogenase
VKALVYTATRRLELQDIPAPRARDGECLVRVRAVGVCGSDLDGFLGRSKKRVPPLVLGHEFSGEIAEIGAGVTDLQVGDAVAVYPLIPCWRCVYCQTQRHQICPERKVFGLDFHGGLAEFVSAPRVCLFPLPPGMTQIEGALVEPLANAVHVLSSCPEVKDRTGLVYGAGPIGVFVFLMARHLGARRLAVVDVNARRLEILEKLGAELIVDASREDPVHRILAWSGGGVDFAVDAVGKAVSRQNCIATAAPGSTVVWIGLNEDAGEIDGRAIVTREISIKGSYAYGFEDFRRALELLAQKAIPYGAFVSRHTLDEGQAVFEDLAGGRSAILKALFAL